MTAGSDIRIEVLGTVDVSENGARVGLRPQLRRLLGLLVVADGDVVSADRMAEYVADGDVGGSTVRTAVSRLRKIVGDRIVSVDGGYRLDVDAQELDAARFEELVARARSASGDVAIGALSNALDLWHGSALGDLANEEWATGWAARLDGVRATAIEDLGDELLDADRARDVVELLDDHVRAHPYRERPVGTLMRALAATGRVADSLRLFERFRVTLRDDTGLDPSPDLRAVEAEILSLAQTADEPAKPTLPQGTVTFLFTDIEGSTERWADDEQAMTAALAAHDDVLRSAVSDHAGVTFKHTGDGMCAVFTSPSEAVAAARAAQEQLELPVRMGVHTGEAELRDDDYFGPTLNRVARIMDAGHGGQILMSRATAALLADADVTDLGEHQLKGLAAAEQIYQHGTAEHPPLRVASARKGNLPTELTPFVGRDDDVDALIGHTADHRLITLLGVGGTGKTRLAIETASAVAPAFPDGTWMAELAVVATPEAVPFAIATGLGVTIPAETDIIDHVIGRIRQQRRLLIVDNCEHVRDAAADAIERLIADCPALTVITTSREPLMLNGEHLVAVPTLSLADAVQLFTDRADSEAPELAVDDAQRATIEELCERLDRLPLAIELAAARLRSMTPSEILERIDQRFRLLVGGRRSRMERHQTMRGTVDWSYELCNEGERTVFDRLSVFVSAFDLDGARAVAGTTEIDDFAVDDALSDLVDRSLVQRVTAPDGTSRFRLLETMRAYGREHLLETGDLESVRTRHADHLAAIVGPLAVQSIGPDEDRVIARLRELVPDASIALDWLVEQQRWDTALRIVTMSWQLSFRVMCDMHARLHDAIEEAGCVDAIEPLTMAQLRLFTRVPEGRWLDDEDLEVCAQATQRGAAAPNDYVAYPPQIFYVGVPGTDDASVESALTSVRDLARWPNSMEIFTARYVYDLAVVRGLTSPTEPIQHLTRLSEALGHSRTAEGLVLKLRATAAGADDRFSEAAELSDQYVNRHHHAIRSDQVQTACRLLRYRAAADMPVRADDLRRPWDWIAEYGVVNQTHHAALSTGVALEHAGYSELAEFFLAWMLWNGIGGAEYPLFRQFAPPTLVERAEQLSDRLDKQRPLDDLIAELFEVADRLEG